MVYFPYLMDFEFDPAKSAANLNTPLCPMKSMLPQVGGLHHRYDRRAA